MKVFAWLTGGFFVWMIFLAFALSSAMGVSEEAQPVFQIDDIPEEFAALYQSAGEHFHLDWLWLAAVGKIESDHDRMSPGCETSSAGARGPMQFMTGTWESYGDGGDICDPHDAIFAAARYLKASGAPGDWHKAIFSYNHAEWYYDFVASKRAEYAAAARPATTNTAPGGIRAAILREAEKTLSIHTGYNRYSQPGAMTNDPTPLAPNRTDCSQWTRAIYLLAGAHDPGGDTHAQIANGIRTHSPQPGDLMFSRDGGHVEIYIGNDKTYGHGSPPINEDHASSWPGHFFVTYPDLN